MVSLPPTLREYQKDIQKLNWQVNGDLKGQESATLKTKRQGTLIDFSLEPECHRGLSRKGSIRKGSWFLIKRTKHCKPVDQKRGFEQRQDIEKKKKKRGWASSK